MKKCGKRRPWYWHLEACTRDLYKRYCKAKTALRGLIDIRVEGSKKVKWYSEICVNKCVNHRDWVVTEGMDREKEHEFVWNVINLIGRQGPSKTYNVPFEIPKPEAKRDRKVDFEVRNVTVNFNQE